MARLLLDTHVLVWWYGGSPEIPAHFLEQISRMEQERGVAISVISFWEIAKLVENGRLVADISLDEWFAEMEDSPLLEVLPLTARISLESTRLGPQFHKDPADQLIVATARVHGLRLLTTDDRIVQSGIVAIG